MTINNKLDHLFASPAIFVSYIFIATGIFMAKDHFVTSLIIIILASFFAFSYTGVEIDTVNRKVKQYTKIFGLLKTGNWKTLDAFPGLTLIPIKRVSTIASRSNLTTSTVHRDYRIFLINKAKRPAFAIKKCETREQAQNSIDEFSIWLKLPVYSVKK